jgi:hypothetical protein
MGGFGKMRGCYPKTTFEERNVILYFLSLLPLALFIWVVWMFYEALARIGEELAEIKTILSNRGNQEG